MAAQELILGWELSLSPSRYDKALVPWGGALPVTARPQCLVSGRCQWALASGEKCFPPAANSRPFDIFTLNEPSQDGGKGLPGASSASRVSEVEVEDDFRLDASVFEEPLSVVEKPIEKPRGILQSTLIPDDWKAYQQYYHRSSEERRAERRALRDQLSEGEEGLQTSGSPSQAANVAHGSAKSKNYRSQSQFSSIDDTAASNQEKIESWQGEGESGSKKDFRDARTIVEETLNLTAQEKKLIRKPDLFPEISSEKWSPLHTLAASGQVYLAAELVNKGHVQVDAVDSEGLTPLHRAVRSGRWTMIRFLLKAGANVHIVDREGATLLHYAVQVGNYAIFKLLMRHRLYVNAADNDGWTPLHLAVQLGNLEFIKGLVYRGADVNLANKDGSTALDLALAFGACFNLYGAIKFLKKRKINYSNPDKEAY